MPGCKAQLGDVTANDDKGMHMDLPVVRNVVLIDYENVQPPSLKALLAPGFTVLVFVGASQSRISIEVAEVIQTLGPHGRYVRCNGSGSNALDFHIAFYIGEMAAAEATSFFHIVSKDTGFDPLVAHLRARGLQVGRSASVEALPMFRAAQSKAVAAATPKIKPADLQGDDRLAHMRACLIKQGKARPGSIKTLRSAIKSSFQNALPDADINALVQQLQQKKWVMVNGEKLSYQLPAKLT